MIHSGVIVGTDQTQEWLLPWWWKHYSAHNAYPVAFFDFGMSKEALSWCKQRGTCIDLTSLDTTSFVKMPSSPEVQSKWETRYGEEIWKQRLAWFKKPFACLSTPFDHTLWLDLDCQVRKSLEPLFHCIGLGVDLAMRKESESIQQLHQTLGFLLPGEVNYNSGVIAFAKQSDMIDNWLAQAIQYNDQFLGDQQALSRAIFLHKPLLVELPDPYNWSLAEGSHEDAVIHHFHGGTLKLEIQRMLT